MKKTIAVFDFDGTLISKDSFLEFIKFVCGVRNFYIGFLLFSPLLIMMKLHLYPNWKLKEKIFSYFFKGMKNRDFQNKGLQFAKKIDRYKKSNVVELLEGHIEKGHNVYVITASIEDWVRPWCEERNITAVIGTKIEFDKQGVLTGRFSSNNCYGIEKVNRLLEFEPHRENYLLYAYGDSRGDREMLAFADTSLNVRTLGQS